MREALLRSGEVELVIDVGAHAGEYGRGLRSGGYHGKDRLLRARAGAISSGFSPQRPATAPGNARTAPAAPAPGPPTINISGNDGFSSSLLAMEQAHEQAVRRVPLRERGDDRGDRPRPGADRPPAQRSSYLKVDTQGYEHEVIAGATETLRRCRAVELELSLTPLYEGQLLIGEMIELMRGHGFRPTHLEPEFTDPHSGELLQVNGLFQVCKDQPRTHGR